MQFSLKYFFHYLVSDWLCLWIRFTHFVDTVYGSKKQPICRLFYYAQNNKIFKMKWAGLSTHQVSCLNANLNLLSTLFPLMMRKQKDREQRNLKFLQIACCLPKQCCLCKYFLEGFFKRYCLLLLVLLCFLHFSQK